MAENSIKNPVQIQFFEKLKQSVPKNISLANEIADILGISADGAYRRMRGESILGIDEMAILCRHYKISSEIIASTDSTLASFRFQKLIHDEKGLEDYTKNILADLQKINSSNPKQIIYAAGDLPMFAQFLSPEFAAFKLFFWQKAVLNLASAEGKKFSVSGIKPEVLAVCKKISDAYLQIPSIEIWHQDTVASNLNLIEFAWESGMFVSKEDALSICQKLSELISLIEKQAEHSSKFHASGKVAAIGETEDQGSFTMYQSEFVLMGNHIFVTAGATKSLYLTHNTFNSMSTSNSVFCSETEEWLKNLIRKSTQISGVGEKQRHKFFKQSQEKITALISRISV